MAPALEKRALFEQCVNTHAESMFRVAFRLLGNQTFARELCQETYLQAWKSLDQLRDPDRLKSWLFSILRNQYTKFLTRETRAVETSGDLDWKPDERVQADPSVDIQSGMEQLEENQRLPVLLVLMEEMSVSEAAEILQIPRGTVLSRLHRGKQKLKEILKRELIDEK